MARSLRGTVAEREAIEAVRRRIPHDAAVREVCLLQDRFRTFGMTPMRDNPVQLRAILRTLQLKRIPFVLTGTHGIAGWTGRPRATFDVDLLVKSGRNHARAIKAIHSLYPQLETRDLPGLTAFFVPGQTQSVVDVIYPHRPDLEVTLTDALTVEDHELRYRVPSLETAIANKYGAMLHPTRDVDKRTLDSADFGLMVRHSADPGQRALDLDKLKSLGEKVWPGGGGDEILRLVKLVRQGKALDVNALVDRSEPQ
jgi:hypothetical protein